MPIMQPITRSTVSTSTKETSLGTCIGLSIILFLLGLALPVAFSLSSTISQVTYCSLCIPTGREASKKAEKELKFLGRIVFWTLMGMYIVLSAGIYALVFTQLEHPNEPTKGLLASVAAFMGTMGLEIFAAFAVCVVVKNRHVIEEEKSCRRRPSVESGGEEAIPRVDSHQVED